MMLDGFGLSGYRSFRGELQLFGPLGKVNLLAGQNNAGKSNVIRALDRWSRGLFPPAGLDIPNISERTDDFEIAIAHKLQSAERVGIQASPEVMSTIMAVLQSEPMSLTNDDLFWLRYKPTPGNDGQRSMVISPDQCIEIERVIGRNAMSSLSSALTSTGGGQDGDDARRVLHQIDQRYPSPHVILIDAFRQIGMGNSEPNGRGLIESLARLQNPSPQNRDQYVRFQAINQFVQTVLEDTETRIEIPYERDSVTVYQGDQPLPLDHYGTGIHQVILLAATAAVENNQIICIEEPEVHLHPLLQRKLIRFLNDHTNNQYLIATHSAHMLDFGNAVVFHLRVTPDGTKIDAATTPLHISALCADLGYRPSDLMQANAVIWVEGPSDRIYVQHWLNTFDAELLEGIHYSIMFYGGALLNHLTIEDDPVKDFISLRRVNRYSAILIDSDKTSAHKHLSKTKMRVRDEFNGEGPGLAWITDGYTIENYVPREILSAAVSKVHPSVALQWNGDEYSNPLQQTNAAGKSFAFDKVAIAHMACDQWAEPLADSKLRRHVQDLEFVREANGA